MCLAQPQDFLWLLLCQRNIIRSFCTLLTLFIRIHTNSCSLASFQGPTQVSVACSMTEKGKQRLEVTETWVGAGGDGKLGRDLRTRLVAHTFHRLNVSEDVLLQNPTLLPCASDVTQTDPMLHCHLAHGWGSQSLPR